MLKRQPLVTYAHLRWDFVYQRPQHVLARMASSGRPVLYVEEPVPAATAGLEVTSPAPGVVRCVPQTPSDETAWSRAQVELIAPMLGELMRREGFARHVAWLYTPMALPLAERFTPLAWVYDCMDELSAFAQAPPEMRIREAGLLARADVVFTGGPSLYAAKRHRHWNVRCFPSSVDVDHFRRAAGGLAEADDQAGLPRPRLGFYGVIDERLDRDLVDAVAALRPEWQLVLVGPVVKIDPATLPRRPNIHYRGQRGYDLLPSYLAGWDVCLLPFARNDATRFISPTKTLEYMAAERPIVSTSIRDVAAPYADVVAIADEAEAFVAACERALAAPVGAEQVRRMRAHLGRTSWVATVSQMSALVDAALIARAERLQASAAATAGGEGNAQRKEAWTCETP
jgi:UDP-galactopyranose mutase